MPLDITLRTTHVDSPFRDRLLLVCGRPLGSRLILASGYFQQNVPGQYRILHDQLLNAIAGPHSGITDIDVIGLMGYGQWQARFGRFVTALGHFPHLNVNAWMAPYRKWHAKVAMRVDNIGPTAAIIGSSNLTRPPYAIAPTLGPHEFNYECDVTIWRNTARHNRMFRRANVIPNDQWIIAAIRDPKVKQPDEKSRLKTATTGTRWSHQTIKDVRKGETSAGLRSHL